MSAAYLTYDHSPFSHPRDPSHYDIAIALDLKPMAPYAIDPFTMEDLQSRLPHSMLSPSAHDAPHPFQYDGPPPLSHSQFAAPGIHLYDVHRSHDLMHPAPVRPVATSQLFPGASRMPSATRPFGPQESPISPDAIMEPSQFVTEQPRPSTHDTASTPSQPPPPPPSWAMSGSLDPATGIYQTAPEHPRVRTAQACEKCRGRKAKCSGEHPTCERCRLRGLKCEYAAERKMRGPNKRKLGLADVKGSRKSSIASSSTSSDSKASGRTSKSPFTNTPRHMVGTPDTEMSDQTKSEADNATQSRSSSTERRPDSADKPKPQHIDLTGTHLYDQMFPPPLPPSVFGSHLVEDASLQAYRRSSLPAHLLESPIPRHAVDSPFYASPRGLDVVDVLARPHSNPMYHSHPSGMGDDMFNGHSGSSEASSSTPITPSSMPEAELMGPLGYHPVFINDFSSFEHFDGEPMSLHPGWPSSDMDATPTEGDNDREKSFTELTV